MLILEKDKFFEVQFPFDQRKVDAMKRIRDGYYNKHLRTWRIPKHRIRELEDFKKAFGYVEAAVVPFNPDRYDEIPEMPYLEEPVKLLEPMYPYQERGVAYNLLHKRVIMGDEPGLGKTIQAVASVFHAGLFPCLVVCPSTMKIKWQREWKRWTGKSSIILSDRVKTSWPNYHKVGMCDVFITNNESLAKFFVEKFNNGKAALKLEHIEFKGTIQLFRSFIIDEFHRFKDPSTRTAKIAAGIALGKQVEMVLGLTGTAVVNGPQDLISQLGILNMLRMFGGTAQFNKEYVKQGNAKKLNFYLNKFCFYRRLKKEVLTDLPDKTRQILYCDITNRAEYNVAKLQFIQYLESIKKCTPAEIARKLAAEVMVQFGILKQVSARGKYQDVKAFADDILASGQKLVLFCHHKEVAQAMRDIYPNSLLIRGGDDLRERQAHIDRFQEDPSIKLAICSIKAAGVGIELTAASNVAFIEFPWTDADCTQCEDRCHRNGQKDAVMATYFLGRDTVDERCYEIINSKRTVAAMINGDEMASPDMKIDNLLSLFRGSKMSDDNEFV